MALDICFDVHTFLERTCRACSRYFSDTDSEEIRFYKIFDGTAEESQPNDDITEIYEELRIWKLNIKPKDGLPQQICNDCFERFLGVRAFREECLDTQKVLESYFKDFGNLTESTSQGRVSPKADLIKSELQGNISPKLINSAMYGSPKVNFGSPKYVDYNDDFYAESFIGTPPPLFEEIKTDFMGNWTLDGIKSDSELKGDDSPKTKVIYDDEKIYKKPASKQMKPAHFNSSDDESSTPTSDEDEDTDEENTCMTTENEDDVILKRCKNLNAYNGRNSLQCLICSAAFPNRCMLKEHHQRAHPQEKPYICNVCEKAFKSSFLLRQHKLKHNRPDTIKCDLCGKNFRSQLHLQRHYKNFHLTSTYTCHICHQKFENYTQFRFQYHVRQHGEKRFQCEFCDKSFHQKIHLTNHERTHSKEQPFSCDICGKAYRQQTACQEHRLTHADPTPFKCKICQKGFTQRSSLRLHLKNHDKQTQQKRQKCFQCKLCGQNFNQQLQYDLHQLTHGNSAFTCHHCNATFKEESYLERHLNSMHGGKRKFSHIDELSNVYQEQKRLNLHDEDFLYLNAMNVEGNDENLAFDSTIE